MVGRGRIKLDPVQAPLIIYDYELRMVSWMVTCQSDTHWHISLVSPQMLLSVQTTTEV